MSLLDIYLQRYGKKRYDVYKVTGLSQQMLANVNKKTVDRYSVKTIQAIAKTLEKQEGTVLDELIQLEKENPYFEVYTPEQLLLAFDNKEENIVIKGEYVTDIKSAYETTLSDTERLGFELGSSGILTVISSGIYSLINAFDKGADKEKLTIEKKIQKYKLTIINNQTLLLSLRQLDY